MGVYINMEMPTKCEACFAVRLSPTGESLYCSATLFEVPWGDEKANDCPLVPVPSHGDLIDRDAYEYPGDLMDEPVIIPAEEVDDDS